VLALEARPKSRPRRN